MIHLFFVCKKRHFWKWTTNHYLWEFPKKVEVKSVGVRANRFYLALPKQRRRARPLVFIFRLRNRTRARNTATVHAWRITLRSHYTKWYQAKQGKAADDVSCRFSFRCGNFCGLKDGCFVCSKNLRPRSIKGAFWEPSNIDQTRSTGSSAISLTDTV